MQRRTLVLASLALTTTALTGCTWRRPEPKRESASPDDFVQRAKQIEGVTDVDTSANPWVISFDRTLPEEKLSDLSKSTFELVNSVDLPGQPRVELASGPFHADVERKHNGGGPQPGPAELRWVRWLDGMPQLAEVDIENSLARVKLEPTVEAVDWTRSFVGRAEVDGPAPYLVVLGPGQRTVALTPGKPESLAAFKALDAAVAATGAKLTEARCDYTVTASMQVADSAQARRLVSALTERFDGSTTAGPSQVDVSITDRSGTTWSGRLDRIADTLGTDDGLAGLVASVGARLSSASARGSYTIAAPSIDVAERVVNLVASADWTPGPDSSVSIQLDGNPNPSSSPATVWQHSGRVWIAALTAGLAHTRVTGPKGGSQERLFDVDFMQDRRSPDLTTPAGYSTIIDVLRTHPWPGRAQVNLAYDDHLVFWTTATGRAQDAYFSLHGAPSRKPTGWAVDFLKAWDATATS